jgi:hypothetical protein
MSEREALLDLMKKEEGRKRKLKTPKPGKVKIKKEALDLEEICINNYTRFSSKPSMKNFQTLEAYRP